MILLDGKATAATLRQKIVTLSQDFFRQYKKRPKLDVILVGDNPASLVYIGNKRKTCAECDMDTQLHHLPEHTSQSDLMALITRLNADQNVHGILVQFPLPNHLNTADVIEHIAPAKDVDGFGPANLGGSWIGNPKFEACTPKGIMTLLDAYKIDPSGKHAVIVGRSNIVGKPIAGLLLGRDATVTITHSKTQDLKAMVRQADIVIAAVGRPNLVTKDWLKKDAVVIDVGINRDEGKLVGDVDYEDVKSHVAAITPVPGGVGPMTIISLLQNVLIAAYAQQGEQISL